MNIRRSYDYLCGSIRLISSHSSPGTQLLKLTHHPIQFVDEIGMIAVSAKRSHKRSVIPKRPVLLSAEPVKHFQTVPSQLLWGVVDIRPASDTPAH